MDMQAKEASIIVLLRCFIICISGCCDVGDGSPVPSSCLHRYTIRHIPPVSATPAWLASQSGISLPSRRSLQTLAHLHIPPFSAKPANAYAFANPPLLGEACKRLRICKSPKQKGRTRRPFKSVARRYKPEYFSVSAQYLLRRIYF